MNARKLSARTTMPADSDEINGSSKNECTGVLLYGGSGEKNYKRTVSFGV